MNRYSIEEFIQSTEQKDKGEGFFELETPRMLEVNLAGRVWAKSGAMITYNGQIKFEREGILEHGLGKMFKKALTGEGASLMKAEGNGKLYLADSGKKISILHLQHGESISVNGNDLLAFEDGIQWDIKMMKRITGMMAGGLFNVTCQGPGMVAITSHYEPLTIRVTPGKPVITDPNATVAWSGQLQPNFQTDVSLKSFFGRGSGESVQMRFEGEGFVVVQPFEEVYMQNNQG
ncbi:MULTISPECIES: AIM24 family protein [Bacillales]|uniref:AIM24 family protein n=1 Tax=Bacillales TaxID=1385 RepID=UPI0024B3A176|nr:MULTISPECIES: AIM24 family protein [Bacillaceae]MDO6656642.1 AIM24 family protein [Anaerobacillus sp. 1_MG-2023]